MYKIINGTPGTDMSYYDSKEKALSVCAEIKKLSEAFKNAKVVKVKFVW